MLNSLQNELTRLGVSCDAPAIIRSQNGVTVARVSNGGESCILKFFERPEFRREIEAYRLLGSLGVPTIRVLAHTDSALLLEDLSASPRWRLAEAGDMADCELAERLAEWYVCLHARGREYVRAHGGGLYDETDAFTRENLALAREKTDTHALPIWDALERRYDDLRARLDRAERTLTYNDFYYTNMAVARDRSAACMFDYNLLGKGLREFRPFKRHLVALEGSGRSLPARLRPADRSGGTSAERRDERARRADFRLPARTLPQLGKRVSGRAAKRIRGKIARLCDHA